VTQGLGMEKRKTLSFPEIQIPDHLVLSKSLYYVTPVPKNSKSKGKNQNNKNTGQGEE